MHGTMNIKLLNRPTCLYFVWK